MSNVDYGAIAGAAGQLAAQLAANEQAGQMSKEQLKLLKDLMEEYRKVPLPELEKMAPEELGPSAFESLETDPALRREQLAAIGELQRIYRNGGMTLEDDAALNRAMNDAAQQDRAGRQRLEESFAARGQLGSGAQLVSALSNQQAAANRANQNAMDRAGMMQRRSLEAMLQSGRLAGDVRNQDYGEKARAAEARDAIARYNAGTREKANYYNAGLGQQQFNNRLSRLNGQSKPTNNVAAQLASSADDVRASGAAMGQVAYNTGRAVGGRQPNNRRPRDDDEIDYFQL